ncbi:MAG: hypothetical protein ACRER3_00155 [Pseudomonas fluorescens]
MTFDVEQRAKRRTRLALLTGVIVVLAIAVVVAVVVASGGDDHDGDRGGKAPTSEGKSTGTTPAISPQALGALSWRTVNGTDLPYSPTSGPRQHDRDLAVGFAHDPLGAVLAAIHITARAGSSSGSDIFEPTIRNQMTGPKLDKFLAETKASYEQTRQQERTPPGKPTSRDVGGVLGFRVEHYDPSYAAIHMLVKVPNPNAGKDIRFDFRVEVKWASGDWKALVPVDENWGTAMTPAQADGTYTKFPGQY